MRNAVDSRPMVYNDSSMIAVRVLLASIPIIMLVGLVISIAALMVIVTVTMYLSYVV
jgi:hypothetical protein